MLDADVTDSVIGEGCVIEVGSFEARLCTELAPPFIFSSLFSIKCYPEYLSWSF